MDRYELQVVTSSWIFRELARTLVKPCFYFSDRLSRQDIADFLVFVRSRSHFEAVSPVGVPRVARQREDDVVLATAVEGEA